jgi:hypothetical protein
VYRIDFYVYRIDFYVYSHFNCIRCKSTLGCIEVIKSSKMSLRTLQETSEPPPTRQRRAIQPPVGDDRPREFRYYYDKFDIKPSEKKVEDHLLGSSGVAASLNLSKSAKEGTFKDIGQDLAPSRKKQDLAHRAAIYEDKIGDIISGNVGNKKSDSHSNENRQNLADSISSTATTGRRMVHPTYLSTGTSWDSSIAEESLHTQRAATKGKGAKYVASTLSSSLVASLIVDSTAKQNELPLGQLEPSKFSSSGPSSIDVTKGVASDNHPLRISNPKVYYERELKSSPYVDLSQPLPEENMSLVEKKKLQQRQSVVPEPSSHAPVSPKRFTGTAPVKDIKVHSYYKPTALW